MESFVRKPAVAGQFYPGNGEELSRAVESYTASTEPKLKAIGCVVPHAGYVYSGHVAGAVFGRLDLPKRFVILCPNHTGDGAPLAIMSEARWLTPLGEISVDIELAAHLKDRMPHLTEDRDSQTREHSLEVELPFLQVLAKDFTFVPITVGSSRPDLLARLGQAMADVIKSADERVMIVASSDMNHYESDSVTRVKDGRAIDRILALDPQGLYDAILNHHITMCGFGPTIAMLTAAKQLGAKSAELIKYATSGDVSGDRDEVVGYAGMVVLP